MGLTNIGLLENTIKCYNNSNYYIYGTFGQKLTSSLVESKIKQYPSFYRTEERKRNARNAVGRYKYAYDCVGLIKAYLFGGFGNVKYNSKYDLSANGMYNKCTEKGKIATIPNIKGLLVWMDGHIGVYDGEKYTYECTVSGGSFKILKTVAKTRGWTNWGKCAYITYQSSNSQVKTPTTTTTPKTNTSTSQVKNTVGKTKILKQNCYLYSKSNLTGTKYTYLKNTTVKVLKNISNTVDYVQVVKTGRKAYIKINNYK